MLTDFLLSLNLSWVLSILVSTLSIYWIWTKSRNPYKNLNIPPYPVRPWPFVGHFFMLGFKFRDVLEDWRKKAGDVYSLEVGGQLHIVVSGYENIKEVLVKNAELVTNTQHLFYEDLIGEKNKGIIAGRDENWKEQRTVSLSILREFGMGKNFLADKIQEEVSVYIEKLSALEGRPEEIRILTNVSVSNVICAIIIGKRFDHEDPDFVRVVNLNNNLVKYFNEVVLLTAFPFLYHLPGDLFNAKKWINSIVELNEVFAKKYITKFKQNYNANEEAGNFITAYLHELGKRKNQGKTTQLDEDNLIIIIRTLFGAGTETTSTTILWCVLYMLHYPHVQEKVYHELEEHVGPERIPNLSDKTKLKYLNAVIMETQRMASLLPVAFRREVSQEFKLAGYTFPKDSIVWPNLDSVMYDKKIWGDPQNFRPERFLDSKGALLNPEELIPFSTGRRTCLGKGLAKMELFLFLSRMFHRFKFMPEDSSSLPPTESTYGVTSAPKPFRVRFIERRHY